MLAIYLKICCLRVFRDHYDTFRYSKLKTLYLFKQSHRQMIGYYDGDNTINTIDITQHLR